MSLTTKQVENSRPQAKPYKLSDGGNLSLHVATTGTRTWRFRCQVDGRDVLKVLGEFPAMTLAGARKARDAERGIRAVTAATPSKPKAELFANVAHEYMQRKLAMVRPLVRAAHERRLERHVYPALGGMMINDINSKILWPVVLAIQKNYSPGIAGRTVALLRRIFASAGRQGLMDHNPAADMRDELDAPPPVKHRAKVVTIEDARVCLHALEAVPAHPVIRLGFRLMALTALRPSECCGAKWEEFSGIDPVDNPTWVIPGGRDGRMKEQREHSLLLSRQAVEVLQVARLYSGGQRWVFPSPRSDQGPLRSEILRELHHRAGLTGRIVPHGWRGTFSTIMNEHHLVDKDVIELMLSHVNKDMVARAYNDATYKQRRRELAQEWADMLLEGAPSAMELVDWARQRDRGPNVLRFEFPPLREVA